MRKNVLFFLLLISLLIVPLLSFSGFFITGVNLKNYPEILVYGSIDNTLPLSCKYVVKEGGKDFSIYDLKAGSRKDNSKVDFIFVFDTTGSMKNEINSVIRKSEDFANIVAKGGYDYQFSLVTFGDKIRNGDCGFTSNVNEFKNWLSKLSAYGGGDDPESSLDALVYASKLPARKDAQKVIILITDAGYHYKGDGTGFSKYTVSDTKIFIKKMGFTLFAVAPNTKGYRELTEGTGKLFDITSDKSFDSIINSIAKTFVNQISFKYKSVKGTPNDIVNFTVKVLSNKGIYTASGSYRVPLQPRVEEGSIVTEGWGVIDPSKNYTQALALAREAALLDAKSQILAYLKGVKIDGETTVADAMLTSSKVKAEAEGIVKNTDIVKESINKDFGVYTVKVKANFKYLIDAYGKESSYQMIWRKNFIKARGVVAINKSIKPIQRAVIMAKSGAIAVAQKELLEAIKGVNIDTETTVKDAETQDTLIKAKVSGLLRGAFVISESKPSEAMKNGYFWVEMGVYIKGENSVYNAVKDIIKPNTSKNPTIDSGSLKGLQSEKCPLPVPITSLIIDPNGFKIKATLKGYTIIGTDGKVIYTPDMISPDKATSIPNTIFMPDLYTAKSNDIAGKNPYIVKAIKVEGNKIYVNADEAFLTKTFKDSDIRKDGRIIVALNKK